MDSTRAQQKALDDELVAPTNHLKIGKSNLRLSRNLNSKEPTLQVVLDALKLTSFYNAFKITADVPEIYMQEFWVTVSRHHSLLHFKLNGKSHMVNVDNFRDMLQTCPILPESLCLSRAQILWGMYHNKNVDYVYLLWEDLVFQVKNKNSKKNKDKYYPQFTKVIVNYFMEKDKAIPRRNKMFWHFARDDSMFTTIRFIFKHQDIQRADSDTSPKKKPAQAPKGKQIKAAAKVPKSGKKNLPTQGVLDVPTYDSDDEEISWKSSDDEDDNDGNIQGDDDEDDDNEQTKSDDDGDDFVHPKLSTHDEEERHDEEETKEDSFDPEVQTPSYVEYTDDEDYDEVTQGGNDEEENMDEEEEVNELYRDVNINLEGRDTEMTDTSQTNLQGTQVIEDTHVILTTVTLEDQQQSSSVSSGFISNMLNPNPNTCIDSILILNTESTTLVDVLVTRNFDDKVKALEDDFLKFKQTNLFAEAVSSIPGTVDSYLAKKMNEAVKIAVQIQSEKYIRFSLKVCTWLEFKFEGDNTLIVIQPPCYSASKDFQDSPDDEEDTRSNDNEMVEVKVLMALAEENDVVSKEGAINTTDYDSVDESSVCSIPLPLLKKLDGAEPIYGQKTIKSILRSKSTFKAEALKDCDIRKPIWYLDSGCSRHMTGVKSYQYKYMEQPGPKVVFGDDSTCITEAFENLNWLWHKRLAHLNFKTINKLAKQNLVIGLPLLVYSKDKPCSSCEKGKHHKASFKTKQTSSIKKCLHLLHKYLFGPVTPRSISHEKYTFVIVDEYSMYTWVYFLKKKSQAPKTIMSFIKRVQNQNDIKVKQLKTKNDTEFRNSTLVNFYNKKQISQNFSSPYTPEQNSVVERKNRTLIEAIRTMLLGSVFSRQHWTEVENLIKKANDGYLLGYSLVSKAFRIFNTRRQQTEEPYHITFDESPEAIKISKPLVNNINIAKSERYPPDEYIYPYEPSQRTYGY
uniref:Retrovirus-related Pol polyprotein from transposon TNT 1-94 n=1 Tax=Tanacetum cinerariifolium TaxID=118510 RepID=A0A6L2LZ19_TANCI|nr:retrovirus-related Pol polyprotein from transposon TNT 1-94 [Tanacetum cinerariifolium]